MTHAHLFGVWMSSLRVSSRGGRLWIEVGSGLMSRLQQLPTALRASLEQRRALKVIAGLMNFDATCVARVARAAGHGSADLIDVACDPALVRLFRNQTVCRCVSSVEPEQFPAAVQAGAAMVEIAITTPIPGSVVRCRRGAGPDPPHP